MVAPVRDHGTNQYSGPDNVRSTEEYGNRRSYSLARLKRTLEGFFLQNCTPACVSDIAWAGFFPCASRTASTVALVECLRFRIGNVGVANSFPFAFGPGLALENFLDFRSPPCFHELLFAFLLSKYRRYHHRMPTAVFRTPEIAKVHLQATLTVFFQRTAKLLQEIMLAHQGIARKADEESSEFDQHLLMQKLKPAWASISDDVEEDLSIIAQSAGAEALTDLNIDDEGMLSSVNQVAGDWASEHAAKLITQISDTTRDQIRTIVSDAFTDGSTIQELARNIRTAGAFSPARAELIARTEASRAESTGNIKAWQKSGVVETVRFVLSADHDDQSGCECGDLADGSPYDVDDAPEVPVHPNCFCAVVIGSLTGSDDEDEE